MKVVVCFQCDRPAVVVDDDMPLCLPCAGAAALSLNEDERRTTRDLIADIFPDDDGVPQYDVADHVWMTLYRAGFDIMRRPKVAA